MKAIVTGASSGIGREIAKELDKRGYSLILVARRLEKLEELKKELKNPAVVCGVDLSNEKQILDFYNRFKDENVEILVNNAGFGILGDFDEIPLEREIKMIETNIISLHMLTKLFLKDFIKKDYGYILNVASVASFFSGPLLSTYYATKAYVKTLTQSIYGELKARKSNVYIGVFCPGSVETEFDKNANVKNSLKGISAGYAGKYAVKQMLKGKLVIIPTLFSKLSVIFSRLLPAELIIKIGYMTQNKKRNM